MCFTTFLNQPKFRTMCAKTWASSNDLETSFYARQQQMRLQHCKRQISNVASIFFGKLSYDIVTQHIEKISIMTTVMIVYIVRYLSAGIQEQKSRQ